MYALIPYVKQSTPAILYAYLSKAANKNRSNGPGADRADSDCAMLRLRLRPSIVATLGFVAAVLCVLMWLQGGHPTARRNAVNSWSTLGFDIIYVVGVGDHEWRAQGLEAAAARTNLSVSFLTQPQWTVQQKEAFHAGDNYSTWNIPGSTGCWLGHKHALSHFLSSGHSSALLLEDDADWDVAIQDQARRTADAVRWLTQSQDTEGWGTGYDIIFHGHCGDQLSEEHFAFRDPTVWPYMSVYQGFHYGTLDSLPPNTRTVHWSLRPVCTFGYAVTRAGARKILALDHDAKAIDVRLGRACMNGELRCITVNPELIHHHVPAGEARSEIQLKLHPVTHAFTANILHSARCNAGRTDDDLVTCLDPGMHD